MTAQTIMISSGEPSGDLHAAELAKLLPWAKLFGMGGKKSREAGIDTIVDSEKSGGVMGFYEALTVISSSRRAIEKLIHEAEVQKPKVLIIIDYPEFNMRLAASVKKLGVKIVYFIPPKVWAWRSHRAKKLGALCDEIATIFPFERKFLEDRGCKNVSYVGHPFSETIKKDSFSKTVLRDKLGLNPKDNVLAVFPGSRKQEILRHLAPIYDAISALNKKIPDLKTIVVKHANLPKELFARDKPDNTNIAEASPIEVLASADFGILKSGTCNLEAAYLDLPFVCVYKASAFAAFIVKTFVKIKQFSPVNIVRENTVTEILQDALVGGNLADETFKLLQEPTRREILSGFSSLRDILSPLNSKSPYLEVVELIKKHAN